MDISKDAGKQRFKKPLEKATEASNMDILRRNRPPEQEGNQQEASKEKERRGSSQKPTSIGTIGVCKPKSNIIPRVILSDLALQAHRDHMTEYTVICKFMGMWLTERALHIWIRSHWKPKGEIHLHMGSKGFFTVVFTSLEDKDRVFEGGPYFYAVAGLYMRPWMMNFVPKHETFTLVPVWIKLYSLPLDYWLLEYLKTIGNKLGHFLKISYAALKGKYTSFAWICVEMDLSGALMDAIILEVYDEEWVQAMDYEHIPFRCRKCHEHGHLYRDCPMNNVERNVKTTVDKNPEGFTKVGGKGKGRKRPKKKINEERQPSHNSFKILEEEEGNKETNQEMENVITEKERDDSMEDIIENSQQKNDLPSIMKINRDHEMIPSEARTEDHELQEILDRENLDLEKFLEQGTTKGVDSLPKEEYDRVQQLFLWRSQLKGSGVKRNHVSQEHRGVKMMEET